MNGRLMLAVTLATTLVAGSAQAFDLYTQRGARQLGGNISFTFERDSNKNKIFSVKGKSEAQDSISGTTLSISPEFWYFVMDNFELGGRVLFTTGFGDKHETDSTVFGVQVGAHYLIPFGSNRFYIGGELGFTRVSPDEPVNKGTDNEISAFNHFLITIPIGVLFPLMDSNVALDVGLRVNVDMDITSYKGDQEGSTSISIPVGYIGVQSFW